MGSFKFILAMVALIMGIASLVLEESIADEKSISYQFSSPLENGVVDGIGLSTNTLVKITEGNQVYLIIGGSQQDSMYNIISDARTLKNLTMVVKNNIDFLQKNKAHIEVPSTCVSDVGLLSSGTKNCCVLQRD